MLHVLCIIFYSVCTDMFTPKLFSQNKTFSTQAHGLNILSQKLHQTHINNFVNFPRIFIILLLAHRVKNAL